MVEPELLKEAVTRLDALGFQVHFHALADRAVREALDAIEAARTTNGCHDLRHHLAHLQVVHPDDLPRFRELGALANAQPSVGRPRGADGRAHDPVPGRAPLDLAVPLREPACATAPPLAMGSDWSVSSPEPAGGDARRGQPEDAAVPIRSGWRTKTCSSPTSGSTWRRAIGGFTMGLGLREPHATPRRARSRWASARTSRSSTGTCSPTPSRRSPETRCLMTFVDGQQVFAAADA